MFHLRHAASRVLSQTSALKQPTQFVTFASRQSIAKPVFARSFHQSLAKRAAGFQEDESSGSTATTEPEQTKANGEDALFAASKSESRRPTNTPQRRQGSIGEFRNKPPSKVLYIGNIFFDVTAPQIQEEFSRYGQVVNSRIVSDSRGLSKGFGYIEFATQEEADRAISEGDQSSFHGRRLKVDYHLARQNPSRNTRAPRSTRPPSDPTNTLFIGNISYEASDKDLNELFKEIQNVTDIRVAIDRQSGQPRGFAHADFIDIAAAETAKAFLESKTLFGRQLRIDYTSPSANSGGPRTRTDNERF